MLQSSVTSTKRMVLKAFQDYLKERVSGAFTCQFTGLGAQIKCHMKAKPIEKIIRSLLRFSPQLFLHTPVIIALHQYHSINVRKDM